MHAKAAVRRSMLGTAALAVVISSGVSLARTAAAAPFFKGLGDLTGGGFFSQAYAVSDDGLVVAGHSSTAAGDQAFRWTQATGMVGLGRLAGVDIDATTGYGISSDGSVVVGQTYSPSGLEAYRWTQATGMVGLGDLPGIRFESIARAVSGDGSSVVGMSVSASGFEAFRWTQGTGMVGLGDLPGSAFNSHAYGISDGGGVVVGTASPLGSEAFRLAPPADMVGIGILPGGGFSEAYGVSDNGQVVVGRSHSTASGNNYEAFCWSAATGMVALGDLPGGTFLSSAYAASADGSIVVGQGVTELGAEAFIWDAEHGMRRLRDALVNDFGLGASLTNWAIDHATAISGDGRFIVGYGRPIPGSSVREAWLAGDLTMSAPPSGDFTGNGAVDGEDLAAWTAGYGGNGQALANGNADADADVDGADYLVWQRHVGAPGAIDATGSVPEPASWSLPLAAAICLLVQAQSKKR